MLPSFTTLNVLVEGTVAVTVAVPLAPAARLGIVLWPIWIELPLKLWAPIASSAENVRSSGFDVLAPATVTVRHSAQFEPVWTQSDGAVLMDTPVPAKKFERLATPKVVPFEPVAVAL